MQMEVERHDQPVFISEEPIRRHTEIAVIPTLIFLTPANHQMGRDTNYRLTLSLHKTTVLISNSSVSRN